MNRSRLQPSSVKIRDGPSDIFHFGCRTPNFKVQPFSFAVPSQAPPSKNKILAPNSKTQRHALDVLSSLESMWKETVACDFTVKVGQKSFHVHRALLIACSDYFKAMFSCFMKESIEGVVDMKDVDESAVESCIEFMYKGETALTAGNVAGILQAASVIQLENLKVECIEFLSANICSVNCISTLCLALTYDCMDLQKQAKDHFKTHFLDVTNAEDFCLLCKDDALMYILEFADNDDSKWRASRNWIDYIRECRQEDAPDFFNMLNLTQFPSYDLMKTAWEVAAGKDCENIRDELLQRIFTKVLELSENITVENCFLLKEMADAYGHTVEEARSAILDFMLKNFPAVTSNEEFGNLRMRDAIALLESPKALFFSSQEIKWNAAINWMKSNPSAEASTFASLLKVVDLVKMRQDILQTSLKDEPLFKKYPECRQIIVDSALARPEMVSENCIALLDSRRKLHVFDMTEKKKHFLEYTAKTNNVRMVTMNGNLCLLDGKDMSIAKDLRWTKVSSLPQEPSASLQLLSCGDCIYAVDENMFCHYCPLTNVWNDFPFIQTSKRLYVASEVKLYSLAFDIDFASQYRHFEVVTLPESMGFKRGMEMSAACINGKIFVLQHQPSGPMGLYTRSYAYNLNDKKWKTISSPSGGGNKKLCTVGNCLAAFHKGVTKFYLEMQIYNEKWDSWMPLPNIPRFENLEQTEAVCSFHVET